MCYNKLNKHCAINFLFIKLYCIQVFQIVDFCIKTISRTPFINRNISLRGYINLRNDVITLPSRWVLQIYINT